MYWVELRTLDAQCAVESGKDAGQRRLRHVFDLEAGRNLCGVVVDVGASNSAQDGG